MTVVTDYYPIAHAQKHLNGYGCIGRAYALNKLYEYSYDFLHHNKIQLVLFLPIGKRNRADNLSSNFAEVAGEKEIAMYKVNDMRRPPLMQTPSPLCDEIETGECQSA